MRIENSQSNLGEPVKPLLRRVMLRIHPQHMDDLSEVVQVNDERGAVSRGGDGTYSHKEPIEPVGACEETREGNRSWRWLDFLRFLHLLLDLHLLRRGGLGAGVQVRRRRFRWLRYL